jgi:hypothetical protein
LNVVGAPQRCIRALTADLAPARLLAAPNDDKWSANDVLAHLRACADVRGEPIFAIIAEATPTLRAVDPRTWIKETDYPDLEFRHSLRAFTSQRADLLVVLEPLPHDGGRVTRGSRERERYLSAACCSMDGGWLATNDRISSRSNAS